MTITSLGDIVTIVSGTTRPKIEKGAIPVYGGNGILGYTNISNYSGPMICIGRVGAYCGVISFESGLLWLSDNALGVTIKNGVNADITFLRYMLEGLNLNRIHVGAAQPVITQGVLRDLRMEVPGMQTQKNIAQFLSDIDAKIVANNMIIETSEKLMREIYDYWFVQFDFPDENGRPYKSSGGAMIHNETLKREIPKGWKAQNLLENELSEEIKPGINKFSGNKTYYATANVINGNMDMGSDIDYEHRESRANMQPIANSIWFAKMKNSVKHVTVLPSSVDLIDNSIFSTGFFGVKTKGYALPHLRCFIYGNYFEKVKDLNSNGATMEAISNDGVKNIKLLIPDELILKNFSDKTAALLSNIDVLRRENKQLASLRDWLLPMLMNGQIKIQ